MGITAFPFSSVIDVPSARILGRDDAGTGSAEALTNTEIFAILGTGTPSASTYLRGDGTWAAVSAGVGGSTGSVDNAVLRADGTGGATLQASAVVIPDNFTASPNATVNHASIQATGDTTNVSVSVVPKGSGSFSLHVPDGTATGGNARGANAVDLQTGRSAASEIATGSFAFAANRRATVSGESSFGAGGNSGGGPNVSGASCFGFGREVTVNASFYAAAFGYVIQQSSSFGFAAGVSLDLSAPECQYSFGRSHINRAVGTFTAGHAARADKIGQRASAIGNFAVPGDAQISEMTLRGTTTSNAAVVLQLGPSTNASAADLLIPSGKVCQFLLIITGVRNGGADVASYMRQVTIKNIGGTTSLVGTVNTIGVDNAAGTSLSVTANDTNDALEVSPTGVSGQTWRWECVVYGGEIGHG